MHSLFQSASRTIALALVFFFAGCATQIVEEPSKITRSEVPLGNFDKVILVKAKIAEPYAGQAANVKAVNKVDEVLAAGLPGVLKNVEVKSAEDVAAMSFAGSNTLLIKPLVKQVKFIGGGAKFFAGPMAGSSVIIMDVAFEDASSGKQLSNPGFMEKAGAYTDAYGIGSNAMLSKVAERVINYTDTNR